MRHTAFALKCFRGHMLLEICSKFARKVKYCSSIDQSAKKYSRVLKMQNSAPNSKTFLKDAQRNRVKGLKTGNISLFNYLTYIELIKRKTLLGIRCILNKILCTGTDIQINSSVYYVILLSPQSRFVSHNACICHAKTFWSI